MNVIRKSYEERLYLQFRNLNKQINMRKDRSKTEAKIKYYKTIEAFCSSASDLK